jgi:hypothetical protein
VAYGPLDSVADNKRLDVIRKRIDGIKAQLAGIEAMRPGSLTRQYKDPENRRGPYYQLSYTRQMRSRTEYVSRDYLPELRREIRNYKRFKALIDQWIALSIEQSRLTMMMKRISRR